MLTFNSMIAIPVFCTPVSIAIAVTFAGFCPNIRAEKQPNIKPHHGSRKPANKAGHVISLNM